MIHIKRLSYNTLKKKKKTFLMTTSEFRENQHEY